MPSIAPPNHRRGFTLIELLVVIAIIAILAAILFPVFAQAREAARKASCLSNMKQIAMALTMYADSWDETVGRKWYEWHTDLDPYVKNGQVWTCPSSSAPKPVQAQFNNYRATDGSFVNGMAWTNEPTRARPYIWGHYTRNDELLHNYGFTGASSPTNSSMASWERPADVILIGETRSGTEDDDTNDMDEDNAPYCEPGGTNWNQVYNHLSLRHQGGQNVIFGDLHAKFVKWEWFKSSQGKYAICPFQSAKADGTGW